jgi:hypothetical protein
MSNLYGTAGRRELIERIGDIRQLAGFQRMMLMDGKGKGNEVIQVRNGSGLAFQINVSRGFDIGLCEFHGIPVSWMSHTGPVAPAFYEKDGVEWGRGFEGGLLATCGLSTIGKPSQDRGESFGQHGRVSYIPAELLQTEGRWIGDQYEMVLRGKVREAKALTQHVVLERSITVRLNENRITIRDEVTNDTFQPIEHLIMYHYNFGYPLVSETCQISLPESRKRWINGEGPTIQSDIYDAPSLDAKPTVMLHEDLSTDDSSVTLSLKNNIHHNGSKKQLQVSMHYSKDACPYLTQWKYPGSGIFVLGLEPGNATTEGRGIHRERGTLPYLQPGETRIYEFIIAFQLKEGKE